MRRLAVAFITLALFAFPDAGEAQGTAKVRRIGILMYQSMTAEFQPLFTAFRHGLQDTGYVEGQNIAIEWHDAQGSRDRLPGLAAELITRRVEAIFAVGPQALQVARQTTRTVPVVAIDLESDPVEGGYVANLAKPGGNITGVFLDLPELMGKWLGLLREVTPTARVAALWDPTTAVPQVKAIETAANAMSVRLDVYQIREPGDFKKTFDAVASSRADAVVILSSPLMFVASKRISDFARPNRLPAISMFRAFPLTGGLMSYGPVFPDAWRRVGVQVGKILSGVSPGNLPVERPSRFELVINLKTAKAFGLTIPQSVLLRADEVIQ